MRGLALLLGGMLLALSLLSWAAAPSGPDAVGIEATVEGTALTVSYDLPSEGESLVAAFPVSAIVSSRVYVFQDDGWQNGSAKVSILRLYDHLREELPLYLEDASVSLVSEADLPDVLSSGNSTLVIASWDEDKVEYAAMAREWVKRGGVIIGIGAHAVPFIIDPEEAEDMEYSYLMEIDMDELDYSGGEGGVRSGAAEALDLGYVAPVYTMHMDDIEGYGGWSVGVTYGRENVTTTHAVIPMQLGRVVLLGGGLALPYLTTAEDAAAQDIERILATDLPFIAGEPLYTIVSEDGSELLPFPEGDRFVAYVMSLEHHVQWFARTFV